MIDTDKYEGHSTEYSYEIISVDDDKDMYATYALLNGAPLLLAEVKRLREQVKDLEYEVEHWQGELQSRMHPIDYDALVNGDEEE